MRIEEMNTLIIPALEKEYKRPGVLKDTSKEYGAWAFYGRWLCLLIILLTLMLTMAAATLLNPFSPFVKPVPTQVPCAHVTLYNVNGQISTLKSTQCR